MRRSTDSKTETSDVMLDSKSSLYGSGRSPTVLQQLPLSPGEVTLDGGWRCDPSMAYRRRFASQSPVHRKWVPWSVYSHCAVPFRWRPSSDMTP
jgi:hypothetical protein